MDLIIKLLRILVFQKSTENDIQCANKKWLDENKEFKIDLIAAAMHYSTSLNRSIVFIATGAISVSIIFVGGNETLFSAIYLIIGWVSLFFCIFSCCGEFLVFKSSLKASLNSSNLIMYEEAETAESIKLDKKAMFLSNLSEF